MTLASVGCEGGFVYDAVFSFKFRDTLPYQLLDFLIFGSTLVFGKMLIDLTQHATRYSDSSGQAQEYLIARHAAVETETVLVQICLELGAPSVICSLKECFQITDCLVYPMQIICFVFLCVQFHTFQIQVASVTVAFYLRFRHKILVDDFL